VRDEPEFQFGGPTHIVRPDESVHDSIWTTYLFVRDNPVGPNYERWLHAYGCGRWFNMVRDTATHEIYAIYNMGDPKPELGRK